MKILVACGGTGGHIFPALSFIEMLTSKSQDLDILLVITKRRIESQIVSKKHRIVHIDISPIKLKFDKDNLVSLLKLFKGALESMIIIFRFNPKVVVGFGGYASFFLVFFAWAAGIKTLIHEQNVQMGLANRVLSRFVDRIAISFRQTQDSLGICSDKTVITGNPLRMQLGRIDKEKALDYFGFLKNRFTILIMGGSLGAHKINIESLKAISALKSRINLQIIHLSGTSDYDFLNSNYSAMDLPVKLFKFLDQMQYAYSAADLCICRAGALTISEIIFYKIPAIIIPYPYAYGHQMANAKILSDKDCAILIEDRSLEARGLHEIIADLFRNSVKIGEMRTNYEDIKEDAERNLSDAVLSLV